MPTEVDQELSAQLREILRIPLLAGGNEALAGALAGLHAADIAEAMRDLSHAEVLAVFNWLDNARAADVLGRLDSETSTYVLENAPPGRVALLLDTLPMDDAAWVVSGSRPEHAERMLDQLSTRAPEDAAEVRELLSYEEGTAGRLMTDKFMRLSSAMSVDEAMAAIRQSNRDLETLNDLYVVDRPFSSTEQLLGVVSLRELVLAPSSERVGSIMTAEAVTVSVDTDQEEVARLISKYDLLNIPVLDRNGHLAGIVTVDDVIDVMVEEFNEDFMRLAGSDAEAMDRRSPSQIARLRLPWLVGTMLIELVAAVVIAHHSQVLSQVVLLAAFMPAISAVSGNVGLQVAAVVVRGLDTGHVSFNNWSRFVTKEMLTSLIMALACGLLLGIVGAIWDRHWLFGVVVGGALACSMLTAALMGSLFPVVSKRMGFDPAATAGPFETAFQDVIGYSVFLWLASVLVPWLR